MSIRQAVDGRLLRGAMGHFATGVSVVASRTGDGRAYATTASAVTSVSVDPPLVLVCLRDESETLAALREHGAFSISFLRHDQRELAERFAARTHAGTWDGVAARDCAVGVPVLDGALATVACELHELADGGDHRIVVGRVVDAEHLDEHERPLVYYRGAFGLTPAASADPPPVPDAAEPTVALPTRHGDLRIVGVRGPAASPTSLLALVGEPEGRSDIPVYLHRGCLLGDALGHLGCPRRLALRTALDVMREAGAGILAYHRDDANLTGCCGAGTGDADGTTAAAAAPPLADDDAAALAAALAALEPRDVRLLVRDGDDAPPETLGLPVAATVRI